ncbi:MAG: iron-containing alcohol dehydrogenase, partial [Gammaproteobacteria bacterium]|nr:iron-containing alcohol dehydrogenase [Gammaproteobacteria bacterium]
MGCQYFSPCEHGADSFTIAVPKLTFGRGCLKEAGTRAAHRGMNRVALFTDAHLKDGPYVSTVQQSLRDAGLDFEVFSEIRIEPDDTTVINAAKFINGGKFDGVVSVGG